jgi:hypothetical protein
MDDGHDLRLSWLKKERFTLFISSAGGIIGAVVTFEVYY